VIAANAEGPSWLIDSGRTGLLFEAGNVEALTGALIAARDNPAMRQGWAEAGLQRWRTDFTEEVICRQYMDFFHEVTQAKRRAPARRRWSA
jgi:glycosyltransferase involved in cell wall biosynthesis